MTEWILRTFGWCGREIARAKDVLPLPLTAVTPVHG